MCCRFCEFWTWRLLLFVVSTVSIIFSFILGPLHLIFYALGMRKELDGYFEKEPSYALMLCLIMAMLWIIFIYNVVLLCACCCMRPGLLNCYVYLVIVNMVFSFVVATKYVIQCTIFDTKCFDHSKERVDDDRGSALVLFVATLFYLIASILLIFVACDFKLSMRY